MSLQTKTKGVGGFFKSKEHVDAVAILIEPQQTLHDRPNGNFEGTRNEVIADVTVFPTSDSLKEGGTEPTVLPRSLIAERGLTGELLDEEGNQFAYKIAMRPHKKAGYKPFAVWAELDVAVIEQVQAYIDRRDAGVAEATAAGLPDFLA